MGIAENKPVYVFDQLENKWYTWGDTTENEGLFPRKGFIETDTPILTKNFAGIGTREINENGIQAIKDVYEKTLNYIKDPSGEEKNQTAKKIVNTLKDLQIDINTLNAMTEEELTAEGLKESEIKAITELPMNVSEEIIKRCGIK